MNIAIVEDDPAQRTALELELAVPGRSVVTGSFANAESALRALPAAWPDIVLVDLSLPGMDGAKLIAQLRLLAPALLCVVHTSHEEPRRIFTALQAGAVGYLLKNSPATDLLLALEEAVAGGAPFARSVARQVLAQLAASPAPPTSASAPPPPLPAPALQSDDFVQVKTGPGAMRFVRILDILLVTSQDNYTELTLAGRDRLLVRSTLAAWQERLPDTHFLRVHRQTILNLSRVEGFEHQDAEITHFLVSGLAAPVRARREHWAEIRTRLHALGRAF